MTKPPNRAATAERGVERETTSTLDSQHTGKPCKCQDILSDCPSPCDGCTCISQDHKKRIAGAISRYLERQVQR
jgi:hypothetical protein